MMLNDLIIHFYPYNGEIQKIRLVLGEQSYINHQ